AVPGPARRLPHRDGGRAQAQGDRLHPRRGLRRRGAQARPDRPGRGGAAGVRHRPLPARTPLAALEGGLQHPGGARPRRPHPGDRRGGGRGGAALRRRGDLGSRHPHPVRRAADGDPAADLLLRARHREGAGRGPAPQSGQVRHRRVTIRSTPVRPGVRYCRDEHLPDRDADARPRRELRGPGVRTAGRRHRGGRRHRRGRDRPPPCDAGADPGPAGPAPDPRRTQTLGRLPRRPGRRQGGRRQGPRRPRGLLLAGRHRRTHPGAAPLPAAARRDAPRRRGAEGRPPAPVPLARRGRRHRDRRRRARAGRRRTRARSRRRDAQGRGRRERAPMIRGYEAQAVREAEAPLLEAGEPLMHRAARALADHVAAHLRDTAGERAGDAAGVLVLAGAGANGGDGLHAAALLRREGIAADAIATADRLHEEGAAALRAAGGTVTALADTASGMLEERLATTTLVLDAILGLGGRPEVPEALAPLLAVVRGSGVPVIAVDLPSFVDASTGRAAPEALAASATVSFGALKAGLLLPGGAERAGALHLVVIGLGPHLHAAPSSLRLAESDMRWVLQTTDLAIHHQFPVSADLNVSGAALTGAVMVRCLSPQQVLDLLLSERPEVVGHGIERADGGPHAIDLAAVGRTDVLVVGPGLAADDPRARCGADLLRSDRSAEEADAHLGLDRGVIDAGALAALTDAHRFGPDVVLTPHRGEAERLATRLHLDPELPGALLAPALARATGATVLLKGAVKIGRASCREREENCWVCVS